MRDFDDLAAFAGHIGAVAAALPAAQTVALTEVGEIVQRIARAKIGEYQPGWAPLAASTVAEKERLGYAPPDNPLLRTGKLRESIGFTVTPEAVTIGSNSQIAAWQELGTSKMPPRPFLGAAMIEAEAEIKTAFAERIAETFRSV